MSEQEFMELGPMPRRGISVTCNINIGPTHARLSKMARIALGNPQHVSIGVSPSGRVRIVPLTEQTLTSTEIDVAGGITRIATYCAANGYKRGKYEFDVKDGVLYTQLERVSA